LQAQEIEAALKDSRDKDSWKGQKDVVRTNVQAQRSFFGYAIKKRGPFDPLFIL
jgi:hypothetical protein